MTMELTKILFEGTNKNKIQCQIDNSEDIHNLYLQFEFPELPKKFNYVKWFGYAAIISCTIKQHVVIPEQSDERLLLNQIHLTEYSYLLLDELFLKPNANSNTSLIKNAASIMFVPVLPERMKKDLVINNDISLKSVIFTNEITIEFRDLHHLVQLRPDSDDLSHLVYKIKLLQM